MFKIGDIVVHKRDICKITEIIKDFKLSGIDYYTLIPINDKSLVIHTPISDKRGLIRSIINKEDAEILIQRIPKIEIVKTDDDRALENEYISLISSGKHEDLIRIIKTTYIRNEEKMKNGRKASEKDKNYFKLAEKLFYPEFSIALNKTYQETKEYVEDKVAKIV